MSSKVASRSNGESGSRSGAARRAAYPAAASNAAARAAANGASYNSRRQPPVPAYRIEKLQVNGKETEVLTIEDTPEPVAGPSGYAGESPNEQAPAARGEPSAKRRKSDGAHISDQPYASSSRVENGKAHRQPAAAEGHAARHSTNKRKYVADPYDGYQDSRSKAPPAPPVEEVADKEGHFIVRPNTYIHDYKIEKLLGQGTFGKVVAARDEKSHRMYAIKVIRNVPKYKEAAKVEIKVLKHLREHDDQGLYKCIQYCGSFEFRDHTCILTPLLGASVFDFLKENQYIPFPYSHVQSFARQLLLSVAYVHEQKFIHTDLKPENILLEDASYDTVVRRTSGKSQKMLRNTSIHLIDFGSATADRDYHASVVSTRHYRAPEIILGMGWSYPCDVWSIGCILVEFVTGEALFQTHENLEHLAMMVKVFGRMPDDFALKAARRAADAKHDDFFVPRRNENEIPRLNFPKTGSNPTQKQSKKFVDAMKPLENIIRPSTLCQQRFVDLLEKLLRWEPSTRWSPRAALKHAFFQLDIADEGSGSRRPHYRP